MNKFLSFIVFFICWGCGETSLNEEAKIKVDLDERSSVSIDDLFSKIEIIPLETKTISLIKEVSKVVYYGGKFFVLDYLLSQLLIFDEKGKFINKISNKGSGPNEYANISDFTIDKAIGEIILLSPVDNSLYFYSLNAEFKRRKRLVESAGGAYKSMYLMNKDTLVLWSLDFEHRLKYYSFSKDSVIYQTFPEEKKDIFCPYEFQMEGYLCRSLSNKVYRLSSFPIEVYYEWDFGEYNNNLSLVKYPGPGSLSGVRKYAQDVYSSEIVNYVLILHGHNSLYKYCQVVRKNKHLNVFYNNVKGESVIFEKTKEGVSFYPVYWTEDWMIGTNQILKLEDLFPPAFEDASLSRQLNSIREEDNPVLIKYAFKK